MDKRLYFRVAFKVRNAVDGHMPHFESSSRHGRLPVTDGRSAEAQYIKRVRNELIAQCGGTVSAEVDGLLETAFRLR